MERPDYRVGVPRRKQLKLILDSDDPKYGGNGVERPKVYKPVKQECDGQKYSIAYPLQPYGVAVFEFLKNSVEHKEIKYDRRAKKRSSSVVFCLRK